MSIKLEELNKRKYKTDGIIDSNLLVLCQRLNKLRAAYGKPMIITSGLRDAAQQADLIKAGKSTATKSKHLVGMAADVADPKGELAAFVKANIKLMEQIGLWFEDPQYTPGWLHCQISPPRSGSRFFKP